MHWPWKKRPLWRTEIEIYRDAGRRYLSDLPNRQRATITSFPSALSSDPLTAEQREMVDANLFPTRLAVLGAAGTTASAPMGHESDMAALPTNAVRQKHGRAAEPSPGILDPWSVGAGR